MCDTENYLKSMTQMTLMPGRAVGADAGFFESEAVGRLDEVHLDLRTALRVCED